MHKYTPLDMTPVYHKELPPIQPFMLNAKQGGIGYHFYSLWYDPATVNGEIRTGELPVSGRTF